MAKIIKRSFTDKRFTTRRGLVSANTGLAPSERFPGVASDDADERKKVLLSVATDDLAVIDENASALGMSRSAYLVAMGKQGASASILDAIARLEVELRRFQADNTGWKAENERILKHAESLEARLSKALHMLEATVTFFERDDDTPEELKRQMRKSLTALRGG